MFICGREAEAKPIGEGMARKVLCYSPQLMICEISLKKGALVPEHRHPHEQSTYVVSGRCRAFINDEAHEMTAGDNVFFKSDMPHRIEALEDTVVLDIFTPMREDFVGR
ncbi:cupin domain-containing protein [Deltaproteobacteria bacterium OttesenSCG-928-M10]|nr:cupin domain-containing protein [Deltaproteobacteria bacterium OttesenSCG-928-M10]